jgi:hypothetical protein
MESARLQREQTRGNPDLGRTQKARTRATAAFRWPLTFNDAHSPALCLVQPFVPSHNQLPHVLQAKLTVSESGDQYEQEADRVAGQVMRMPDPGLRLQRKCGCGGLTTSGAPDEESSQGHYLVQRSAPTATTSETDPASDVTVPHSVHEVLRSSGQPLDALTRSFMESRFGRDFSAVRVHTGEKAAESALAVNARAYTVGHNIVFEHGQYAPGAMTGRKLLAHELAHVVQQSGTSAAPSIASGVSKARRSRPGPEADSVGHPVADNGNVRILERPSHDDIQRVAPAAAAAPALGAFVVRCILGAVGSMAVDAAIQYGTHLWRLGRWPWERAHESWESYRHDWCSTVISALLGCLGGMVALKWLEPFLARTFPSVLGGTAGATLLGRLIMWLATRGLLLPRVFVKWLAKFGCIGHAQAEALYPGITSGENVAEAPETRSAHRGGSEAPA